MSAACLESTTDIYNALGKWALLVEKAKAFIFRNSTSFVYRLCLDFWLIPMNVAELQYQTKPMNKSNIVSEKQTDNFKKISSHRQPIYYT